MGTFHHDKGELHGITVLVETESDDTWVGRCDTVQDGRIVLLGADRNPDPGGREQWIRRAAMAGFFPRHDRVVLDLQSVTRVVPLGQIEF